MTTFNILVLLIAVGLPGAQKQTAEAPLYNESGDARAQISAAIAEASRTGKNVVLDFGANWCGDCRALDEQMRRPPLSSLIAKSFVVVKIDVGRFSRNLDMAEKYHVPIRHGIPALAVLDKNGALLYAMDQGQFADARHMSFESITAFFEKWKPKD
jgi:protein disulfide-isomerase